MRERKDDFREVAVYGKHGVTIRRLQSTEIDEIWKVTAFFEAESKLRDFPIMNQRDALNLYDRLLGFIHTGQLHRIETFLNAEWGQAHRIGSMYGVLSDRLREKRETEALFRDNPIFGMF